MAKYRSTMDILRRKIRFLKEGRAIITNDAELDQMMAFDDSWAVEIRSVPNPGRIGVKDQYIAWIGRADFIPPVVQIQ